MLRLRLVEVYRDRRIVTNGKLFGVEDELITDCRYMSVEGARAAIDSELGVAEHRRNREQGKGATSSSSSPSRARAPRSCALACGWRGGLESFDRDQHGHVVLRCPDCGGDRIDMHLGARAAAALSSTR
jgi:hypothetical protein